MANLGLSFIVVLAIIYLVPFIVYAAFSARGGVKPPEGSPARFLLGVLVSKVGTAFAFVGIFALGRDTLAAHWLAYGLLWWGMYVLGEVGQAVGPTYTWQEALAGVISETVYFPLSAYVVSRWII